jgi:thiosulfate/3-mercaptopyruvate sulfurtransferase
MPSRKVLLFLVAVAFFSPWARADSTPPTAVDDFKALISTEWLAEHAEDPGLIVLHVGRKETYDKGHIPGAQIISVRKLIVVSPDGIRDEMPPLEDLTSAFTALGVSNDSRVVVYFDDAMLLSSAARVFVTLEYLGMGGRVALLDGGLPKWKAEERPLSKETPPAVTSDFEPDLRGDLIVSAEWVSENLDEPEVVILDARPEEQYGGQGAFSEDPRPGHISGAVNMPFFTVLAEEPDYLMKSETELRDMFQDAGAKDGSLIVTYCGTGIWSAPIYLTARYLGYEARFYDGSFQEWSRNDQYPVTRPVEPKAVRK